MRKRLLIFDLDGTLLDTVGDLTQAVNHALSKNNININHNKETISTFVGNGIGKLIERAIPCQDRNAENIKCVQGDFVAFYNAHNTDLTRPYPGITETLEYFQNKEILLAIASNKYQKATEQLVAHYFPTINFCNISGQKAEVPIKPHPAIINNILSEIHIPKEDVLYIGDSEVDMQTGVNAEVDTIGVSWGFREKKILQKYSPFAISNNTDELKRLINNYI